jgi:hypothetical protein
MHVAALTMSHADNTTTFKKKLLQILYDTPERERERERERR